ncbi:Hypothetical predicted protein [Mytilus galloprovincialis]|uniref:Uncharacterized protein n=1 Tax=Mytilus galloprovincialis TaxID=29158 RepID=A0A8B6DM33_MYTGA|nr:Hypothetical predicted protein [Mytilus galloprovincialis]
MKETYLKIRGDCFMLLKNNRPPNKLSNKELQRLCIFLSLRQLFDKELSKNTFEMVTTD